jgi:hypothetical protein
MNYFSAVEIVENVVLRWVPRPVITGMTATAIPEAIRPYSIAVAALSSLKNRMNRRIGTSVKENLRFETF